MEQSRPPALTMTPLSPSPATLPPSPPPFRRRPSSPVIDLTWMMDEDKCDDKARVKIEIDEQQHHDSLISHPTVEQPCANSNLDDDDESSSSSFSSAIELPQELQDAIAQDEDDFDNIVLTDDELDGLDDEDDSIVEEASPIDIPIPLPNTQELAYPPVTSDTQLNRANTQQPYQHHETRDGTFIANSSGKRRALISHKTPTRPKRKGKASAKAKKYHSPPPPRPPPISGPRPASLGKYRIPGFSCIIDDDNATIFLVRSDGSASRAGRLDRYIFTPTSENPKPPVDPATGKVYYYLRLSESDRNWKHWSRKLGMFLAQKVLGLHDARRREYTLANFPDNYALLQHRTGDPINPRTDSYLIGSSRVTVFRSPREFYPHLRWLVTRKEGSEPRKWCDCQGCKKRRVMIRNQKLREERRMKKKTAKKPVWTKKKDKFYPSPKKC